MGCIPNYTKKQWILISSLALVSLSSSLCASLQAPFYPQEAEKKGATATEYGLVFGIFEFVSFVCCPMIGKNMGKMGAGFVLKAGIMITGSSTVVFGFLDLIDTHWCFVATSFLLRIVEALGVSAIFTSSLSIVVVVFEDSFARVFTILEILQGLGYMIGPTVGGYLYEVGGFILPFAATGSFILGAGLYIIFTLPQVDTDEMKNKPQTQITSVLRLVPVLLAAMCVVVQAMGVGFLTATLEPHLRQFNLTPVVLGTMFVISGFVYMVIAPMVGILCDKRFNTKKMIMLGSVINVICIMLIGPLPYTPLDTSMWLVGVGLFFDGLGMAFMFVPAFVDAITSAIKYGLPDNINTYAIVSGIYASSFALGAFVGPSVAGFLFDTVGFRKGTIFIIVVHSITFLALLWFLNYEKVYERKFGLDVGQPEENGVPKSTSRDVGPETEALHVETGEDALVRRAVVVKMQTSSDKRYSAADVIGLQEVERRLLNAEEREETVDLRV